MRKKPNIWISFVTGMLAFTISQIVLRLPLLNMAQSKLSVRFFMMDHPVLYILILAFTAGLFEEIARYMGFTCIKKNHHSLYDALAFGLGHGGVEAMLIVGIPLLQVQADIGDVSLALIERIFAMLAHVMMSLIVWYGVKEKAIRYLILAIFFHMGLDCYGLLGNNIWIIEGYLIVYVILLSIACHHFIIKKVKQL